MIKGILIINNHGLPRLTKFYQSVTGEEEQQSVIRQVFQQVSQRPDSFCNYLAGRVPEWGDETKIIYRHYATLYFVFAVDKQESDLGITRCYVTWDCSSRSGCGLTARPPLVYVVGRG